MAKTNDRFKPFEIKPGMTLAPVFRRKLVSEKMKEMDKYLTEQVCIVSEHDSTVCCTACLA